ncbi:MAG: PqqD family protein [Pyrinomonadaceae bacterium]|nr:PqqD family protein [Pyrinomonadaceae bacterium]
MKPKARRENLKVKQDTGELFIEDVLNAKYIHLNPTSAYVWEKCDGNHEPVEIAQEMGRELGVSVSEKVVAMAIDKLSKEELVSF